MSGTVVMPDSASRTDNSMLTSRSNRPSQDQNLTQELSGKGKAVFG
jgi:hypothetical protein